MLLIARSFIRRRRRHALRTRQVARQVAASTNLHELEEVQGLRDSETAEVTASGRLGKGRLTTAQLDQGAKRESS